MVAALALALAFQPSVAMLRSLFEQALAERRAQYGESDARTAQAARDLGQFLLRNGEPGAGRDALADAVRMDETVFGPNAPQTLADVAELAALLEPAAAEPMWRRSAASPDAAISARSLVKLGEFRERAGDRAAAAKLYRQALAKEELATGKDSVRVASRLNALALVVEPDEAVALLERALRITTAGIGARRLESASIQMNLAARLVDVGNAPRAARVAHDAAVTFEELLGPAHSRTIASLFLEGRCLEAAGDRVNAEKVRRRAEFLSAPAAAPESIKK